VYCQFPLLNLHLIQGCFNLLSDPPSYTIKKHINAPTWRSDLSDSLYYNTRGACGRHADLFTALVKCRNFFFKDRKCLSFCIQQFNFTDTKTLIHKLTERINYNPWLYAAFNGDTNRLTRLNFILGREVRYTNAVSYLLNSRRALRIEL
jgi:hypothetical protein